LNINKKPEQEIVEHKNIEEKLSSAVTLLQNVINTSQDHIFIQGIQPRTILCNIAFAQATGKKPEELYGRTDIENGWPIKLIHDNL